MRDFCTEIKPVLERTVQALRWGRTDDGRNQDGRHDAGLPRALEGELGPLIRELKQLNPRVSMKELRELGGFDIRRLPRLPQHNNKEGCIGALMGICENTERVCRFGMVPEARLSGGVMREFCTAMKPVLERTVQAMQWGRTDDGLGRYRSGGGGGGRQPGRR